MSYLRTYGDAGDPVTSLAWGLIAVSAIVLLVVTVALLGGMARRRRLVDTRALAVTRDAGGLGWIYTGVSISAVVLAACAVWTMLTLRAIAMPAAASAFTIHVTAAQWWWRVRYENADASQVFTTANEIHIPVGRPVKVELESEDVIHSFWIPQLAGKIDVIPGRTNVLWLHASKAGTYRGQCGEFCGAQHAHMAMFVVADESQSFEAWRTHQLQATSAAAPAAVQQGERHFVARCGACHTVRGTEAGGILGPDLSHLASRGTIAAGLLPNTPENLAAWISNPQSVKPGARMPAPEVSPAELQSVVAWLQTLH